MSLAFVKDRSRQRLETKYHNKSPIVGPLVIGVLLIALALFILPSKTVFRCSKTVGDPSLNDVCTYQSTTFLAGSSLARTLLPRFMTGQSYYFYLGYIEQADVVVHRHEDHETHTVTYSYDVALLQRTGFMNSASETKRRADFFDSADNLHYPEYSAKTISLESEQPVYTGIDSQVDAYRLRTTINKLLDQYKRAPQNPLFFEKVDESWMDEIFLLIGSVLIVWASCLVSVTEEMTLDEYNKTLIIITKPLLGFVLNTEFIPLSQIVKFDIETCTRSQIRGGGRHGPRRTREEPSYSAKLVVKSNNVASQPSPHRVTNPNGANTSTNSNTSSNNNSQPPSPPHNNTSYSPEIGEDGEYILMNQPSTQRPQPPPPPPQPVTPENRTIELLCGQSYGEGHQGAVTEYVTMFQDWVSDFQRRHRMKEEEREHILRLADQALQRQLVRETADSLRSPSSNAADNNNDTVFNRRDRTQVNTGAGANFTTGTQAARLENDFGDHNDEVIDETPEQTETGSQLGDAVEEVPTAPLLEASDIELTEQQISFLLRRRNQRLLHDHMETNGQEGEDGSGADSPMPNPSQGRVCCVCMDENEPVKTVLMPCKHLILCSACSAACDKCPMCRRPISYTIDVFY